MACEFTGNRSVISVPETEPHCSVTPHAAMIVTTQRVISVPETEPHCSFAAFTSALAWWPQVISVPETEPHCSPVHPQTPIDNQGSDLRP
mgnify:FL=1